MCFLTVPQAPDVLIRRCSWYMSQDGSRLPLDAHTLASISATQESFAGRGQRVLLLAKKVLPYAELDKEALLDQNNLEDRLIAANVDLTVLGLVALVDPPREDTAHTVAVCRRAGIRFCMVTGDFAITAAAIAQQVGIITNPTGKIQHLSDLPLDTPVSDVPKYNADKEPGDPVSSLVLSGSEMMTMTDSQWAQVLSVRSPFLYFDHSDRLNLNFSRLVRRDRLCPHQPSTKTANCPHVPRRRVHRSCHRRWSERRSRSQAS